MQFSDFKDIKKVVSLEEELFNEDVIRLNSKSPDNINSETHTINLESPSNFDNFNTSNDGQISLINESFEASLASSVCGEDSEGASESHEDVDIKVNINVDDSIKSKVRLQFCIK